MRAEPLRPIRRGQHRKTDERENIPIRRRLIIDREQKIKGEDRHSEPKKVEDLELLPGPSPICDHRPGEGEKEQRREGQEMPEEKAEQFERMNA